MVLNKIRVSEIEKIFGVFGVSGFGREVMQIARDNKDFAGLAFLFVDDSPVAPELLVAVAIGAS